MIDSRDYYWDLLEVESVKIIFCVNCLLLNAMQLYIHITGSIGEHSDQRWNLSNEVGKNHMADK